MRPFVSLSLICSLLLLAGGCAPQHYLVPSTVLAMRDVEVPSDMTIPAQRVEDGALVRARVGRLDLVHADAQPGGRVIVRARPRRDLLIAGGVVFGIGLALMVGSTAGFVQPCNDTSGDFRCLGQAVSSWGPLSTGMGAFIVGASMMLGAAGATGAER